AASTHGHRQTTGRLEPLASKDSQTNHRALIGGRGSAILVQFPELTGLGHRGIDAAAGTPVARSPGSESRRSSVVRSADPRSRQGQQDPFSAAGPGSEPTPGPLFAAGAATDFNQRSVCFSQG